MRPDRIRLGVLAVAAVCRQRRIRNRFTTPVTYGVVNVSNLDIQLDDAFHRTQRTSINLMWNPVPFVDIVVEYLAGTRVNKNGQRASSSQIQSGWTLKF